jgi:hypothetical protein
MGSACARAPPIRTAVKAANNPRNSLRMVVAFFNFSFVNLPSYPTKLRRNA